MLNILVIVGMASLVLWIAKRERIRLDLIRVLRERTREVEDRLAHCTIAIRDKEAEIVALEGGINDVGSDIRRNQENIGRVQSHLQTLRRLPRATLRSFDKVHNPLVPLWVADVSTVRGGEAHRHRYLIASADMRDAENTELRALADYRKSLVNFERAQHAPGGGGGGAAALAGGGS